MNSQETLFRGYLVMNWVPNVLNQVNSSCHSKLKLKITTFATLHVSNSTCLSDLPFSCCFLLSLAFSFFLLLSLAFSSRTLQATSKQETKQNGLQSVFPWVQPDISRSIQACLKSRSSQGCNHGAHGSLEDQKKQVNKEKITPFLFGCVT